MKEKTLRLTLFAVLAFLILSTSGVFAQTTRDVFRSILVRNNATILGDLSVTGSTTLTGGTTGAVDLNGAELTIDADADTSLTADTDDTIDIEIAAADEFQFTAGQFTIGDASAGDDAIVFDGNAQDYYIALDDGTDDLYVGLGATVGTTIIMRADENQDVTFDERVIINGVQAADSAATNETLEVAFTTPVDTTGTNTHNAITVDLAIGNASGGTNAVRGLQIDGITGDAQVTETGINIGSGWDTGINTPLGLENVGSLTSVCSLAITYTAAAGGSGTVCTIGDGEIWIIHKVFANVTTNFDATGDDALVNIGDGNDADGLLDLDDAELQAADTEGTGAPAGWQGFMSTDTRGAYLANGHGFIYAPSGADETIDYAIDETSGETITAGALTVYVEYTRLQ